MTFLMFRNRFQILDNRRGAFYQLKIADNLKVGIELIYEISWRPSISPEAPDTLQVSGPELREGRGGLSNFNQGCIYKARLTPRKGGWGGWGSIGWGCLHPVKNQNHKMSNIECCKILIIWQWFVGLLKRYFRKYMVQLSMSVFQVLTKMVPGGPFGDKKLSFTISCNINSGKLWGTRTF